MQNIKLKPNRRTSTFRRFAIATWKNASEATMYGSHDIRVEKSLKFIDDFRSKTGRHLTITHLVARGIAEGLAKYPDTNVLLRAGRLYQRDCTGVSLMVLKPSATGGADLSYATLYDLESKTLETLVEEADKVVTEVRANKGTRASAQKRFSKLPTALLRASVKSLMFVTHTLNVDLSKFGIPRDMFGSVVVTNVGAFGLRTAYAPLVAETRVPMVITIGDVRDTPVVEDGNVVAKQVLRLNVSIDHRVMDASHAAKLTQMLSDWLEDPARAQQASRNGGISGDVQPVEKRASSL